MAYAYGEGWKLRWAPALVDRIRTWHRQGRVDVRWATTWCPYADQLEALWALPRLERALSDEEAATHASAAKLRAALAVVEHRPPTRLIWTDDEIPQDKEILHRLHAGPMPSLLIAPPANRGLSRADLDRIDQFLELANVTNGEHPA